MSLIELLKEKVEKQMAAYDEQLEAAQSEKPAPRGPRRKLTRREPILRSSSSPRSTISRTRWLTVRLI